MGLVQPIALWVIRAIERLCEVLHHLGEFHRHNVFGGWAGANLLKRIKILQHHRALINLAGFFRNGLERGGRPLSADELCLAFTLCL